MNDTVNPTSELTEQQKRNLAEKAWARELIAKINAQMGFVPDPEATPEKARALMRACGIRAEDNLFSRDIIRARYPDEYGEEDKPFH